MTMENGTNLNVVPAAPGTLAVYRYQGSDEREVHIREHVVAFRI